MQIEDQFATTSQAAKVLGAKHVTVSQLCQSGRLPAVKIANRWLIRKDVLEEFAKTYVPKVGHPRTNGSTRRGVPNGSSKGFGLQPSIHRCPGA